MKLYDWLTRYPAATYSLKNAVNVFIPPPRSWKTGSRLKALSWGRSTRPWCVWASRCTGKTAGVCGPAAGPRSWPSRRTTTWAGPWTSGRAPCWSESRVQQLRRVKSKFSLLCVPSGWSARGVAKPAFLGWSWINTFTWAKLGVRSWRFGTRGARGWWTASTVLTSSGTHTHFQIHSCSRSHIVRYPSFQFWVLVLFRNANVITTQSVLKQLFSVK